MKIALFPLMLLLVLPSYAQEEIVNTCVISVTQEEAQAIILNPQHIAEEFKRHEGDLFCQEEEVVHLLLEKVDGGEQPFFRQVAEQYADGKVGGHITAKALRRVGDDDTFFKRMYETATQYSARTEAFLRINDLAYVKERIERQAAKAEEVSFGQASPASTFLEARGSEVKRAYPEFINTLAESAQNSYIKREAARLRQQ